MPIRRRTKSWLRSGSTGSVRKSSELRKSHRPELKVITVVIDSNTGSASNPRPQDSSVAYREDVYQVIGALERYYGRNSRYAVFWPLSLNFYRASYD